MTLRIEYPRNQGIFDGENVTVEMMMRVAPHLFEQRIKVPGYNPQASAHVAERIVELDVLSHAFPKEEVQIAPRRHIGPELAT
jgi:hypothetical protein